MSAVPIPKQDTSERQSYGRIEAYIHSDSITQNKGGALVRVTCGSEAGAHTQEFIRFVRSVARFAYAASATCWLDITRAYPNLNDELEQVRNVLREPVNVTMIKVMKI